MCYGISINWVNANGPLSIYLFILFFIFKVSASTRMDANDRLLVLTYMLTLIIYHQH